MKNHKIFESMENDIHNSQLSEDEKRRIFRNLFELKEKRLNIMISGATGAGKSSTINAMFDTNVAKVGTGVDPETMSISKYELGNMILWDSPGLGDGKEKDNQHSKAIIKKLNELDEQGEPLIDLVLIILDGSTRDLGTSYELINSIVIPNLGENKENRLLVAINQADTAYKGKEAWDYIQNKPTEKSRKFLDEKVASVKNRIKEATGVNIDPIYYCAGYQEDEEEQRPYNLSKLMYLIVKNTPSKKRLLLADNISKDAEMWKDDDEIINYNDEIRQGFLESVVETAKSGAEIGADIGRVFGKTGETFGRVIGSIGGAVLGGLKSIFSW
ncbi:50S ribosome-binding GTPase [Vibrio vulnificus]|nr:50S ribosome-binding GTPase [Vibrio vulnificus]